MKFLIVACLLTLTAVDTVKSRGIRGPSQLYPVAVPQSIPWYGYPWAFSPYQSALGTEMPSETTSPAPPESTSISPVPSEETTASPIPTEPAFVGQSDTGNTTNSPVSLQFGALNEIEAVPEAELEASQPATNSPPLEIFSDLLNLQPKWPAVGQPASEISYRNNIGNTYDIYAEGNVYNSASASRRYQLLGLSNFPNFATPTTATPSQNNAAPSETTPSDAVPSETTPAPTEPTLASAAPSEATSSSPAASESLPASPALSETFPPSVNGSEIAAPISSDAPNESLSEDDAETSPVDLQFGALNPIENVPAEESENLPPAADSSAAFPIEMFATLVNSQPGWSIAGQPASDISYRHSMGNTYDIYAEGDVYNNAKPKKYSQASGLSKLFTF